MDPEGTFLQLGSKSGAKFVLSYIVTKLKKKKKKVYQ